MMDDTQRSAPLLIIVSGKPATGKTTLARRLAVELRLPCFAKDDFKELLFDTLGARDRAWSRRLGMASFALLRLSAEAMLRAGQSLILEANFDAERDAPFYQSLSQRHGARVAQVWLTADTETLLRRFEERAASLARHPGHVERAHLDEFRVALLSGHDAPLPLPGQLLTIDTTNFALEQYDQALRVLRLARDGANAPAEPS